MPHSLFEPIFFRSPTRELLRRRTMNFLKMIMELCPSKNMCIPTFTNNSAFFTAIGISLNWSSLTVSTYIMRKRSFLLPCDNGLPRFYAKAIRFTLALGTYKKFLHGSCYITFLMHYSCHDEQRKRRTGIGSLNPNSDANIAVHISAVANPSTIATDYILQD